MKQLIQKIRLLSVAEVAGHTFFWWFMAGLSITADVDTDMSFPGEAFQQGLPYGMVFNAWVFYFNFFYLVPRFLGQQTRRFFLYVFLTILITSVLEAIVDMLFLSYLGTPATFPEEFFALILVSMMVHTAYWLLSMPIKLARDWFGNYNLQKQIEAEHTQTELALLKSQVHPHFLFNTLNTLYSSSYEYGDTQTADGIGKLSHLLRYMLYETKDEKVLLENEIDYLQDYIDLQKMRFSDDVTINFTIVGEPGVITVAPMMFITLVENAFKHGISPAKHATIDIELTIKSDKLRLIVENDILRERHKAQLALEGNSGGLGLENLKRRLSLIYPDNHRLSMHERNNRYVTELELL